MAVELLEAVRAAEEKADGIRRDHIWTDGGVLPVEAWADGSAVYTYALDGWRAGAYALRGTADFLPDGLGSTLLSEIDFAYFTPERYAALLDGDGLLTLTQSVDVRDYATGDLLETATLTARLSAPSVGEWRAAYETVMP